MALIYGTGHIGSAISQMLQRFGVKTVGVHRHSNRVDTFDETIKTENAHMKLSQVDFVINTLPLTKETTHMFNADFFEQMNTDGIFINVGRGGSVDTDGLYQALEQHQIKGAALDVVEEEPLPTDSKLWELSNLIITPHVSGTVPHLRREMFKIFYPNLKSFVDNQTLTINQVDLENGY
ncbi:NAD(P)-dependent oxidoreductase [Pediococcus argentinicus]|uniref:NAD(P)-dependent oxidoreductase n=1 Tax=Pediococcus argentinicus TaxID=480391 RepID=UPI00338E7F6A